MMSLQQLLPDYTLPADAAGVVVSGLQLDSRRVGSGDAFIAVPGVASDGRRYIAEAIRAGLRFGQIHPGGFDMADLEQQRFLEHQRAVAGGGIGTAHRIVTFNGGAGLPARCIGRAHDSTSSSAEASVSMSSSVVVSVTATSSPFARFPLPGNRRPSDTPARTPSSAS